MIRLFVHITAAILLAGCSVIKPPFEVIPSDADPVTPVSEDASTATLTSAPPPAVAARTEEALDTTTLEQRAEASVEPKGEAASLGTTVVSLGSPTEPGFWLKTPLVKAERQGRVRNPANGKSLVVTLIPIEGPATAGSRMSLPAMRLIEVPLTELTQLEVFDEG